MVFTSLLPVIPLEQDINVIRKTKCKNTISTVTDGHMPHIYINGNRKRYKKITLKKTYIQYAPENRPKPRTPWNILLEARKGVLYSLF